MTTVTREHRAEASALMGLKSEDFQSRLFGAVLTNWIETGEWDSHHASPTRSELSNIAQALADRDARIGELIESAQQSGREHVRERENLKATIEGMITTLSETNRELTDTKTQLARVVGALRELRGETCGGIGCVSVKTRDDVDAILKEFEDAK